jgi:hypothetical protein
MTAAAGAAGRDVARAAVVKVDLGHVSLCVDISHDLDAMPADAADDTSAISVLRATDMA